MRDDTIMDYAHEYIVSFAHSRNATVAASVANAESSNYGQRAAIELWQAALALEGDEALNAAEAAFAQAELAKHQDFIEQSPGHDRAPQGRERRKVV
jgi:hypothetical protein